MYGTMVAIAARVLISALILAAPLADITPATAQGVAARAYSARELNLVYSLTYQSSQAQAALTRQFSARLNQQKKVIDAKDIALGAARRTGQQSQAKIDMLERELGTLKAEFNAELAAKDSDFSRERQNLEAAANDLLKTDEGKRALEIYLAGGPGSAEAAIEILQRVAAKRNAADKRATAELGLDALNKGRLTSAYVLKLYEDVVAADPGTHWDWVELARLYKNMNSVERAKNAAEQAIKTASDDRAQAAGLDVFGDILLEQKDIIGAILRYERSHAIVKKLAAFNPSSVDTQRDVWVSVNKIGEVLFAQNDIEGAYLRYNEALITARVLSRLDPKSLETQRNMLVSLIKIGNILAARSNLTDALSLYEESLVIARARVNVDPSLVSARRYVSVCLNNIGDILFVQNDFAGAFKRFEESLSIVKIIAEIDPASAEAQRDELVSLYKLASLGGTKYRWATALTQLRAMQSRNQILPSDMSSFGEIRRLAAAEEAAGNPPND